MSVAALLLSTGFVELNTGQVIPFALLALVLCGLLLQRGNDRLAGIFLRVDVDRAHRRTSGDRGNALLRAPRALDGGFDGRDSRAPGPRAVGGPVLLAYAVRVVPAQAASEIHFPFQYSLTYALAYFGFSPGLARLAGALSYLALLVIELLLAPRVTSVAGRRELLVFFPASAAVWREHISIRRAMLRDAGASGVGRFSTGARKNRFRDCFARLWSRGSPSGG